MNMIEINLLPRELRRNTSGLNIPKSAIAGLAGAAAFVCVLGGLTFWQTQKLSSVDEQVVRAQQKVESMRADIELVDRLTSVKRSIAQRLEAIETLDRNRGEWVRNLEDIVAVIPDYLWLSGFRRNDFKTNKPAKGQADTVKVVTNDYLFDGYCYSLSSLANLILNMQDSPRFSDVALRRANFTDVKDRKVYQFTVFCLLQPVSDEEMKGDQPVNPADLGGIDPNAPATEISSYDESMDEAE